MDEVDAWLILARAPGLGPVGARRLLAALGAPAAVLEAPRARLRELGAADTAVEYLGAPDREALARDREWLRASDHHLVTWADDDYPPLLGTLPDPPPVLWVVGRRDVLSRPQVAVVGARGATPGGRETAHGLAGALARAGLVVTSGLAEGIDAAAHRGALDAGGLTVAVCGTGVDRVYPARHLELARAIAGQGALLSEQPLGTAPQRGLFPRRNRLISGLSLGVVVVEAARRSGSLITARLAAEQGREVFAVPGSVHNPKARGCHALLRDGATLVEEAGDVLSELNWQGAAPAADPAGEASGAPAGGLALDGDYARVLEAMGWDPVSVDDLVERAGLTPEALSSMLLMLELEGYVCAVGGGCYTRNSRGR